MILLPSMTASLAQDSFEEPVEIEGPGTYEQYRDRHGAHQFDRQVPQRTVRFHFLQSRVHAADAGRDRCDPIVELVGEGEDRALSGNSQLIPGL